MSRSSNRWLVVLLCVNVVLATAIVYHHVGLPRAEAQVRSGSYVLLPTTYQNDEEALCIVDTAGQRMTTCRYNKSRKSIEFNEVLDMKLALEELEGATDKQKGAR